MDDGEVGREEQVLLVMELGCIGPVVAASEGDAVVDDSELVVHVVSGVVDFDVDAASGELLDLRACVAHLVVVCNDADLDASLVEGFEAA